MARLSLSLDKRSKTNGASQIRLRINHRGTSAFVGTGVYIEERFFIPGSIHDPIHQKAPMAMVLRDKVSREVRKFEEFLSALDGAELARLTAPEIKERVCGDTHTSDMSVSGGIGGQLVGTNKKRPQSGDFLAFFDEYTESRRTAKTRES